MRSQSSYRLPRWASLQEKDNWLQVLLSVESLWRVSLLKNVICQAARVCLCPAASGHHAWDVTRHVPEVVVGESLYSKNTRKWFLANWLLHAFECALSQWLSFTEEYSKTDHRHCPGPDVGYAGCLAFNHDQQDIAFLGNALYKRHIALNVCSVGTSFACSAWNLKIRSRRHWSVAWSTLLTNALVAQRELLSWCPKHCTCNQPREGQHKSLVISDCTKQWLEEFYNLFILWLLGGGKPWYLLVRCPLLSFFRNFPFPPCSPTGGLNKSCRGRMSWTWWYQYHIGLQDPGRAWRTAENDLNRNASSTKSGHCRSCKIWRLKRTTGKLDTIYLYLLCPLCTDRSGMVWWF